MRTPFFLAAVLFTAGCPSSSTPSAPPPAVEPEPATPSATLRAEVQQLSQRFGDGSKCDTGALERLRGIRDEHGATFVRDALVNAFQGCDDLEAVAGLYRDTLPEPPTDAALLELGVAYVRAAEYSAATEVLSEVADRSPPGSKPRWIMGFALLHAGRAEEALPLLVEGRQHASGSEGSEGPLLIGLAHLQLHDLPAAITQLEAATALDPGNPAGLSALTRAYASAGRHADAARLAAATREANHERAVVEQATKKLSVLG
ncbi:MAG: hypothetical protein KDA24_29315, partial [Deltaproteobacteria bacterium]|nr:hypothetical protein [Deltaproteobacteria bacterium]